MQNESGNQAYKIPAFCKPLYHADTIFGEINGSHPFQFQWRMKAFPHLQCLRVLHWKSGHLEKGSVLQLCCQTQVRHTLPPWLSSFATHFIELSSGKYAEIHRQMTPDM